MKCALLVCLGTIAALGLYPASASPEVVPQPLFASDIPLVLRIEAPFGALERQTDVEPEWLEGRMILTAADGSTRAFAVEVKARGQFRRKSGACDFPTFWINLKKSEVPGTVFENQNKLKVVSHCRERESFYDRYLHREYLAYKTYNLLTEASFRVRLASITYAYTDRRRTVDRPAFLIEDDDRLAERLGGTIVKNQIVLPAFMDPLALNRADLFQYLLGNTDFDFMASEDECCHNAKVVAFASRDGTFIPVPYDFDLSGIVNPPYATVAEQLEIRSVTERYYRGFQVPREVLESTLAAYAAHRDDILRLWSTTPLLDDGRDRDEPVKFLQEFFAELGDPQAFATKLERRARSPEAMRQLLERKYPEAYQAWQRP
ncbi:MAG: hypothetical protein IAE82_16045 [Opitutaceae bacterium]|nr:hypothetical protein [Opitutaceae bacterium]